MNLWISPMSVHKSKAMFFAEQILVQLARGGRFPCACMPWINGPGVRKVGLSPCNLSVISLNGIKRAEVSVKKLQNSPDVTSTNLFQDADQSVSRRTRQACVRAAYCLVVRHVLNRPERQELAAST
jgi:hypothetical protein